jgi:hypothetical protein
MFTSIRPNQRTEGHVQKEGRTCFQRESGSGSPCSPSTDLACRGHSAPRRLQVPFCPGCPTASTGSSGQSARDCWSAPRARAPEPPGAMPAGGPRGAISGPLPPSTPGRSAGPPLVQRLPSRGRDLQRGRTLPGAGRIRGQGPRRQPRPPPGDWCLPGGREPGPITLPRGTSGGWEQGAGPSGALDPLSDGARTWVSLRPRRPHMGGRGRQVRGEPSRADRGQPPDSEGHRTRPGGGGLALLSAHGFEP